MVAYVGLSLKMNHEFSLSELPLDLAAVLRDYDVDNSGSVSVAELVAGAQLMRQQAKKVRARSCHTTDVDMLGDAAIDELRAAQLRNLSRHTRRARSAPTTRADT